MMEKLFLPKRRQNIFKKMNKMNLLYRVGLFFKRLTCFFIDHDLQVGSDINRDPDYCTRCYLDWPQDNLVLSDYLRKFYDWVAEVLK